MFSFIVLPFKCISLAIIAISGEYQLPWENFQHDRAILRFALPRVTINGFLRPILSLRSTPALRDDTLHLYEQTILTILQNVPAFESGKTSIASSGLLNAKTSFNASAGVRRRAFRRCFVTEVDPKSST